MFRLATVPIAALALFACTQPSEEQSRARIATEAGTGDPAEPITTNPLRPGIYVREGSSCQSPPETAFRIVTSTGISGSDTRDCEAEFEPLEGANLKIVQQCVDNFTDQRSPSEMTLRVEEGYSFSTMDEKDERIRFARCEDGTTPPWLSAAADAAEGLIRIRLEALECDDNCTLVYRRQTSGAQSERALCAARACEPWNAETMLPEGVRGRLADAAFGTAALRDSTGQVVDDQFPAITRLRLAAPEASRD